MTRNNKFFKKQKITGNAVVNIPAENTVPAVVIFGMKSLVISINKIINYMEMHYIRYLKSKKKKNPLIGLNNMLKRTCPFN